MGHVGEGAQVVGQVGVAPLDHIPVRRRDFSFQRHDRGGPLSVTLSPTVSRAAVDKREHLSDVRRIGGQDLGVLRVVEIRLVRQPDAGLTQVQQVTRGVLAVSVDVEANTPANSRAIDPQVGWEQHKFLIAWTLVYLPENQKQTWLDMMNIWHIGADTDPGFNNRIELHTPTGDIYVARTYGTETICFEECRTVQRGIGARILEYDNELLAQAYVTTAVTQGNTTWYIPDMNSDGMPIVRYDPELEWLNPNFTYGSPPEDCNSGNFEGCECTHNASCMVLQNYLSVPDFMRQAMRDFNLADPTMKGIYGG